MASRAQPFWRTLRQYRDVKAALRGPGPYTARRVRRVGHQAINRKIRWKR